MTHRSTQAGSCDCCANGGDMDAYNKKLLDVIGKFGWAVQAVTDPKKPFAYTVGLTLAQQPELYLDVPIPALLSRAGGTLNALAAGARDGKWSLEEGNEVYVEEANKTYRLEVTDTKPLNVARSLLDGDEFGPVRALRCVEV